MLTGCGAHLTKEQVIDYGEIGYSDIVSYIVTGYQTNWVDMDPKEMTSSRLTMMIFIPGTVKTELFQ